MATRKDLLKAQSFTSRRMIAAFVDRDPDDPTPPLRRVGTATFVSVLVGVVLLAGTALLGLLGGGVADKSWKEQEGVILADTKAGALFVWNKEAQELTPMADVTSARLLAAGENPNEPPRVINVKTEALRGEKQGPRQGIAGAPRQLPDPKSMETLPIRLCSTAPTQRGRYVTVEFGSKAQSSREIAFVAETTNGNQYLIAGGKAHELWREPDKESPLAPELMKVVPGDAWIYALPLGDPINPIQIPNRDGEPANNPLGMKIGQFAVVQGTEGSEPRYYVQLDEGLTQIAYVDMQLLTLTGDHPKPRQITDAQLAAGARHKNLDSISSPDLPMGKPVSPEGFTSLATTSVCATFTADDPERVALSVGQPTPELPDGIGPPTVGYADYLAMEPMSGALLVSAEAVSADAATTLVIDGRGYPIPDKASRVALGYGETKPAAVPSGFLNLLRPGLPRDGTNLSRFHVGALDQ